MYKVGSAGQQSSMRKEVSMATLGAATTKGTVTLNPVSEYLPTPILTRGRVEREKGLKIKQANCPFSQAGKQVMSTGCLAPLAPMVIPGSQYSNFISNIIL